MTQIKSNPAYKFTLNIDLAEFRKVLLEWYFQYHRRLPWRETGDPYLIWVSEVMLQQTQVKKVLDYFDAFIRKFPTVSHLANADLHDVLKAWERLGYYARARNLHKAAQILLMENGGKIPENFAEFRKLPGVGDYIAAAVMSIAFSLPVPVVDGNVKRVVARLFLVDEPVNRPASFNIFHGISKKILDQREAGQFNQAMMELGAVMCRPRNPLCQTCPVSSFCLAFQKGVQQKYPVRLPAKAVPEYQIAVGIVIKDGKLLITRRKEKGLLGGLWEFPGGKIESGESADQACLREIKEEVNLAVEIARPLTRIRHAYTHFRVVIDVFVCRYLSGRVKLKDATGFRWIRPDEIDRFPFPAANLKFIPLLKDELDF